MKENVPFKKSLEYWAKDNNKEYLLSEYSIKNLKSPDQVSYGDNDKYLWVCSICNREFPASIGHRTISETNCPHCKESKGEKKIREWLEKYNFKFSPQKKFKGLIGTGGKNLSYDFYLHNLNLLIEYQGEFHDGSGRKYTQTNLENQQEHDKRKRDYALKNNIDLLEIWYRDFDNIENILNTYIKQ
jgi:DNA-directed RNA polymerase subunit RPC12/RpoP